jgi:ROS/MUCR transcriptional regulator protein
MRVVGRLPDGTPYFAPLGSLAHDPDEDLVQCHLCGGWFRFLGSSHLARTHGWTLSEYRDAFELRAMVRTCSRVMSEKHRQDANRRVDAGEFGPVHLPAARAALEAGGERPETVVALRARPRVAGECE